MQEDLFGPSSAVVPSSVHNVFFALLPDESTLRRMTTSVESLRSRHGRQGRWLKPERYHMTLHFLGTFSELPLERIASACTAAGSVKLPAFELVLDRSGHFSKGIGWLGCARPGAGLQQLWEELRKALAHAQVGVQGHSAFKPHVTVLRDVHDALPDEPIDPVAWPVREFVLIDSVLGQRSEYRVLGRWMLDED